MTRMSLDLLCKCTGQTRRRRDETQEQFLRRVTHLYCAEKEIKEIDNLSVCRSLSVLYLYDNHVEDMSRLSCATNLTHLYLQNNQITRIQGLSGLLKLEKLYLGHNCVTVVEGLEGLRNLRELHIESQSLPEGEKLIFDPRSLKSISRTLMVLNVNGNGIESLQDLKCLVELTILLAAHNGLDDFRDLGDVFDHMPYLWKVDLYGNPCSTRAKYRDRIITMVRGLGVLDGRDVTDTERRFLKNWQAMREGRMKPDLSRTGPDGMETEGIPTAKNILQFLHQNRPPPTMPPLPQRPPLKGPYGRGSSRSGTFVTSSSRTVGKLSGREGMFGAPRLAPVFEDDSETTVQRLPQIAQKSHSSGAQFASKQDTRLPQLMKKSPKPTADHLGSHFLRVVPPVGPMVS